MKKYKGFTIKWPDEYFIDIFDYECFRDMEKGRIISHKLKRHLGIRKDLKCYCLVKDLTENKVDLDYSSIEIRKKNNKLDLKPGLLRLTFSDKSRTLIKNAEWQGKSNDEIIGTISHNFNFEPVSNMLQILNTENNGKYEIESIPIKEILKNIKIGTSKEIDINASYHKKNGDRYCGYYTYKVNAYRKNKNLIQIRYSIDPKRPSDYPKKQLWGYEPGDRYVRVDKNGKPTGVAWVNTTQNSAALVEPSKNDYDDWVEGLDWIFLSEKDVINRYKNEIGEVKETEREAMVKLRIGQGRFREDLLNLWSRRCCVTGCEITEALKASHIKPWSKSSDIEKLDPKNGLLLIANLDALFDRFLISFQDDGILLVSNKIPAGEIEALNLKDSKIDEKLLQEKINLSYLGDHRKEFDILNK